MKTNALVLLSLILFTSNSCNPSRALPMTISRDMEGTAQFRTDGVYYRTQLRKGQEQTVFIVFYQNGVASGFKFMPGSIEDLARYIEKEANQQHGYLPLWWGIYNVEGNTLNVEHWVANGPLFTLSL